MLGLSMECFRWDLDTPSELTYGDVVAGHLPVELRRQRERREFNYMGRPINYFSRVPECTSSAEQAEWLIEQAVTRGLDCVALPIEFFEIEPARKALTKQRTENGPSVLPWAAVSWTAGDTGLVQRFESQLSRLSEHRIDTVVVRHAAAATCHHFTRPLDDPSVFDQARALFANLATKAQSAGVVLALENHLDFQARHLAKLIHAVDHAHVQACLNTANAIGVVEDPLDAARALAPFTHACFLRDFRVQPNTIEGVPQILGTPLGSGHVPLRSVLQELEGRSPAYFVIDVVPHRVADSVAWVDQSLAFVHDQLSACTLGTGSA